MWVFKLFSVICALAVPQSDCTVDNANDQTIFAYELHMPRGEEPKSDLGCLRAVMLATTQLAFAAPRETEYQKLVCIKVGPDVHAAQ